LWTYDGSSTEQATTADSEIYLKPVVIVTDPFRGKPHIITLCETYRSDKTTPARYNFRHLAVKIMDEAKGHKPWFGIEQEYFLMKRTGTNHTWPLGTNLK
jgi:glutamine synthetase